ncbi:hypothetical protein PFICI_01311 [Pestalotiopsis fici W106-1]|uniref:DNA polymerase epsilon subunit D n=1 Tax=Pestalotiopsis fici (strain W106-1 / CGMCC3.15140) TaxID=1229662 RepID=W3XN53_PESFW|nr:uncharacterized protein PFICI_01311 [Pestalotiopsis fici W106-1]ETS87483.1 hypothetical protein PFICI_01311 [Pestalotiopsis fici W106-1]
MPPRKIDTSRRSDVSMARFALVEGDATPTAEPSPISATAADSTTVPPASTTAKTAVAETPDIEMERASEAAPHSDKKDKDATAIEDLNLPKSIITRLAKGVLPPNTQIQANAILAMTKAATVFINHLANAANERTQNSNKKTIMPPDVFDALDDIEYPEFKELVQQEFKKFNEIQSSKRNTYRRKVAAAKKGVPYVETNGPLREPRVPEATGPPGTTFIEDPAAAAGIDTSRSIKKQRMSAAAATTATGGGGGQPGCADDSAMAGADADTTQEYQDAESESDHVDEDDEDEPGDDVDEEEDDEEEEGAQDDDEMQDALEEREEQNGEDEALDNGEDSDS